ncbi:MAG: hypothetical protein ACYS8W_07845 [Planctomycetota bacterium]|jgi:hypothetical protein
MQKIPGPLPALIIITTTALLSCGCCSQAEIITGAVLTFHAAPEVPADIAEECETALRSVFFRELGLALPERLDAAGARPENPWTLETLGKAALESGTDLAVTANVASCRMEKTENDPVPRPVIVIEFVFTVPEIAAGKHAWARRLEPSRDNGAAPAGVRFAIAAEIAAERFIARLKDEFEKPE